jgi:hypothetical protein
MGGRADGLIGELIQAAVFSGAYGALARQHPEAVGGFVKMRAKWSARVEVLAGQVVARAATQATR